MINVKTPRTRGAFRHTIFIVRNQGETLRAFRYATRNQIEFNVLIISILSLKGQWSNPRIDFFYKYAVPIGTNYSRAFLKCNCLPIQTVKEPFF
jgi:hypothetical protein